MDGKATLLPQVANESFVIIRESVMAFFEYKYVHAALVNFFAGGHSTKIRTALKNLEMNRIAETHGEPPVYDTSLWQIHSVDGIYNSILKIASVNTLNKVIGELQSPDVIVGYKTDKTSGKKIPIRGVYGVLRVEENTNPKYKFDKRKRYLYLPEKLTTFFNRYSKMKTDLETLVCQHNVTNLEELVQTQKQLQATLVAAKQVGEGVPGYPRSTENAAQVLDFPDCPNLGNRVPRSGESLPNIGGSLPKIGDTIASIQQDSPRIAEAEPAAAYLEKINSNTLVEQKQAPFAEQHFTTLADTQAQRLLQRFAQAGVALQDYSVEAWVGAIDLEMQNPDTFKNATTPTHKLNCILAEAKRERWSPAVVVTEDMKAENAALSQQKLALEDELRRLHQDKTSWEQVLHKPKLHEDNGVYANSARKKIAEAIEKITTVKVTLHTLTQQQERTCGHLI